MSERLKPTLPRVALFGAGPIGQAVARTFSTLPVHLDWLASRGDARPEAAGTDAILLGDDELVEATEAAPADSYVVILTHSHELDYRLARAALARDDLAYVGMIGSRTKRAGFDERMKADGLDEAALARLACPIGIPGLKSREPAVIAIGIAAQVLQAIEAARPSE